MQIVFKQPELEEAIRDYVVKCGVVGVVGTVSFTAGRGDSGITTEIDIDMSAKKPIPTGLISRTPTTEATLEKVGSSPDVSLGRAIDSATTAFLATPKAAVVAEPDAAVSDDAADALAPVVGKSLFAKN